jgi:predicted dehydrogenase
MFEISGEHGTLRHDSEATAAIRLERSNWAESGPGVGPRAPVSHRGHSGDRPYAAELRHFVDRIGDGTPFLTDGVDGLRALELALATLESIRTGRPVTPSGRGMEQAR